MKSRKALQRFSHTIGSKVRNTGAVYHIAKRVTYSLKWKDESFLAYANILDPGSGDQEELAGASNCVPVSFTDNKSMFLALLTIVNIPHVDYLIACTTGLSGWS